MTTNAVCTIVRTLDDGSYFAVGVYPCMWQETEAYEVKKYGEERADHAAVYIPNIGVDVLKGDYIARGDIAGEIDVSSMLTVSSVTRHDYGSADMQHIRIGAR